MLINPQRCKEYADKVLKVIYYSLHKGWHDEFLQVMTDALFECATKAVNEEREVQEFQKKILSDEISRLKEVQKLLVLIMENVNVNIQRHGLSPAELQALDALDAALKSRKQ